MNMRDGCWHYVIANGIGACPRHKGEKISPAKLSSFRATPFGGVRIANKKSGTLLQTRFEFGASPIISEVRGPDFLPPNSKTSLNRH